MACGILRNLADQDRTMSDPETQSPISAGVPISQGCDHLCTYCIVRLRRGPEVSRAIPEIVDEVQDLVRRGAQEVTLSGAMTLP